MLLLWKQLQSRAEGYTKWQVEGANRARDVIKMLGFPFTRDFEAMVCGNLVQNCPVIVQDIHAAKNIFGPDIVSQKGKTV